MLYFKHFNYSVLLWVQYGIMVHLQIIVFCFYLHFTYINLDGNGAVHAQLVGVLSFFHTLSLCYLNATDLGIVPRIIIHITLPTLSL